MDRLNELWPEFWQAALETLYMTSFALVLGGILGLAVGVLLYVTCPGGLMPNRFVSGLINFAVNFFRPIPFVIFMAVAQPFARLVVGSGIGTTAGAFIIGLAAAFAIGRIVEQHLVSVSPESSRRPEPWGRGPGGSCSRSRSPSPWDRSSWATRSSWWP